MNCNVRLVAYVFHCETPFHFIISALVLLVVMDAVSE